MYPNVASRPPRKQIAASEIEEFGFSMRKAVLATVALAISLLTPACGLFGSEENTVEVTYAVEITLRTDSWGEEDELAADWTTPDGEDLTIKVEEAAKVVSLPSWQETVEIPEKVDEACVRVWLKGSNQSWFGEALVEIGDRSARDVGGVSSGGFLPPKACLPVEE